MVYKCNFCQKECKSLLSKSCHERFCKLNPEYEENLKVHVEKTCKLGAKAFSKIIKEKTKNDPLNQIKEYNFVCSKCGKKYSLNLKIRDFEKGHYSKFCSRSCANSRIRTDEIKRKISEATKKVIAIPKEHVCPKCGKKFIHIGGLNQNVFCDECRKKYLEARSHRIRVNGKLTFIKCDLRKSVCKNCKKEIYVKVLQDAYCYECVEKLNIDQHLRLYSKEGKKLTSPKTKKKLSENAKKLMAEGKIKPWLSRNIISYAERFWRKVLSLNKIDYQPEKPEHGYFLDFVIETKSGLIDLEIDGKQHWNDPERSQHDKERDKVLTELGYKVYRVPWNTLNTLEGKEQMRSKIQNFLAFYKNLN